MDLVTAVFFDLDDTLYDREALVRQVVLELYESYRSHLPGLSRVSFVARLLELDNHGYSDKDQMYRVLAAEWDLSPPIVDSMRRSFWECYHSHGVLPDDTGFTLSVLRRHGRKTGIITNGRTDRQRRKIADLGLDPLVDAVLVSEAEGLRKPDPAIFLRACDRCGVEPGRSMFVGDNPDADVGGARAAGLIPVLKRVAYRPEPVPGVVTVDRLSEILPFCLERDG